MSLKLDRETRKAFFRNEWPRVSGEGESPVPVGYIHELSSRLSLEVLDVRTTASGGWSLEYKLIDNREEPHLQPAGRRIPVNESGELQPITENEEHGYGGNPRSAIDAGRRVPPDYQQKISDQAREGWSQYVSVMRANEIQDQEIARQATVIANLLREARKRGVDARTTNSDYIDTLTKQIRTER